MGCRGHPRGPGHGPAVTLIQASEQPQMAVNVHSRVMASQAPKDSIWLGEGRGTPAATCGSTCWSSPPETFASCLAQT